MNSNFPKAEPVFFPTYHNQSLLMKSIITEEPALQRSTTCFICQYVSIQWEGQSRDDPHFIDEETEADFMLKVMHVYAMH